MNKDNRTDEELNRIIAEWCGWVPSDGDHKRRNAWLEIAGEDWPIRPPNYCRDLNAVHEACQKLFEFPSKEWIGGSLADDYDAEIQRMSAYQNLFRWDHEARQRSEALVKVIESSKQ